MASVSRTADVAPLAALAFGLGLFTTAVLSGLDAPNAFAVGVLALVAITIAAFGRPIGALAVALPPALFADHFFVRPYDSLDFAPRDLAVFLGILGGALVASVLVRAFALLPAWLERRRMDQLSRHDRWLLSLTQTAQLSTERHSVD
jgi:hypothetical protein